MDLRDKLRQMGAAGAILPKPAPAESDLERIIPGEVVENAAGTCYRVVRQWPLDEVHGAVRLDRFTAASPEAFALAGKDDKLTGLDLREALFIDTETTGLAGGAGTVPFLIGLGWIEGEHFRVEQYFMREYHEEAAVLRAIEKALEGRNWLVSYNGKSYDLSLLASRYVLNRARSPFEGLPHWDLLHAARRFWKSRLTDCSLGSVERHILDFSREGDVPGFMIPQLYFDYLRDKRTARLEPVFSHNQLDIVSLLGVAGVLGGLVSSPQTEIVHGEDWLALARLHADKCDWAQAIAAYAAALRLGLSDQYEAGVLWQKSLCHKRVEQWDEALAIWRQLSQNGALGVLPHEEAAKYFEHRAHDLEKARQAVQSALKRLTLRRQLGRGSEEDAAQERLNYRLARLERKRAAAGRLAEEPLRE